MEPWPPMEIEWETVYETPELAGTLRRARLPSGWLYERTHEVESPNHAEDPFGFSWTSSLCFVPYLPGEK